MFTSCQHLAVSQNAPSIKEDAAINYWQIQYGCNSVFWKCDEKRDFIWWAESHGAQLTNEGRFYATFHKTAWLPQAPILGRFTDYPDCHAKYDGHCTNVTIWMHLGWWLWQPWKAHCIPPSKWRRGTGAKADRFKVFAVSQVLLPLVSHIEARCNKEKNTE